MTDDELLVDSYKKIIGQIRENSLYLSKDKYEYTKELIDECADLTAILDDILPEITGLDSMNNLDEEDYAFMFEMLNSYAEHNFFQEPKECPSAARRFLCLFLMFQDFCRQQ